MTRLPEPGEVFLDEWEGYQPRHAGPGISTLWLMDPRDEAPHEVFELEDVKSEAWDLLCD